MNHLEQKPNNDFASKQMLCNFITYYAGSLEGVGDYVMAKTVLIKQLHLARLVESYDKESRALSSMSKNWIRLGDYEKALDTLHACSDILSLDFKKRNQRVREEIGVLGAQLCQGLDQLPHNPSKGQVEFSKMDHSYMYAANAAKIGDVLKHQAMDKHGRIKSKDREKIISYYRQAIDHLEEGEDKIRKGLTEEGDFHLDSVHMGQANFLRQMAVQQGSGGRYEEALKNLYKAIDVSHKCKANDSDICNALAWKAAGKVAMDMWFEYDSKHGKSKSTSMSMTSRSRSRSRSSSPMDGQQMSDVGDPCSVYHAEVIAISVQANMKQRQKQKMRAQLWSKKLRMTKEMSHHHHVLLLLLQHQHHRKYHYPHPHPNQDPNSFVTRVQGLPILPIRQEIICPPIPMPIQSSGRHCAVLRQQ